MNNMHYSAILVLALCTACATPQAPYPNGPVRKLNLDKRPAEIKTVPAAKPQSILPRYNGEF